MVFEGFVNPEVLNRFRKCCDNCVYLYIDIDESVVCSKDVANDEYGEIIINSDTFYCSYYRFINSLGSYNE